MGEPKQQVGPLADFLIWEATQPERYELIDGHPVPMAGGSQAHSLIAANLLAILRPLLRGSPCRRGGSDLRLPVPATGRSRYPDVTIDCGRYDPQSHDGSEPMVVFEVLSATTRWYDQTKKLADYDSIVSVRQYVCISQDEPRISLWTRAADGRLVPQGDVTAGDFDVVGIGKDLPGGVG